MKAPSKSPEAALADCVATYGERGPASAEKITSINRLYVKTWLVANGVPSVTASGFPLATLREIWADTSDACLTMWTQNSVPAVKPQGSTASDASDNSDDKAEAARKALRDLIGATQLDERRVIELINLHAKKTVRHELILPNGKTATLSDEPHHAVFPELLAAVSAGLNVLLVGPAGSGKTHVCAQVAKALGLEFGFTGAVMQEHKLLGFRNPLGELVRTEFRNRYEHGGLFLFDEMDASSPQALLAFNAGLANSAQDFPDCIIRRHADFRCVASANTFGTGATAQYVGRNPLDAASRDRFYFITMGYDADMERAIYTGEQAAPVSLYKPRPLSDTESHAWTDYVHKVRASVQRLAIQHVVSGRAIAAGHKALAAGIPHHAVEQGALWKGLDAATVAKIKAGL